MIRHASNLVLMTKRRLIFCSMVLADILNIARSKYRASDGSARLAKVNDTASVNERDARSSALTEFFELQRVEQCLACADNALRERVAAQVGGIDLLRPSPCDHLLEA